MKAIYFSRTVLKTLFFIFNFSFFIFLGQNPQGSSTLIQTCIRNTNCYHTKTPAYIYYDEAKEEMIFKIDLSTAGQDDSLGKWVQGIKSFEFRAPLSKSKFPPPSNYNSNYVTVSGITSINGITHPTSFDMTIYEIENNFTNNRANNNSVYDAYRLDLTIPVVPEDYDLGYDLRGTIYISVNAGVINQVYPAGNIRPQ